LQETGGVDESMAAELVCCKPAGSHSMISSQNMPKWCAAYCNQVIMGAHKEVQQRCACTYAAAQCAASESLQVSFASLIACSTFFSIWYDQDSATQQERAAQCNEAERQLLQVLM
jgi:hypothetical protein